MLLQKKKSQRKGNRLLISITVLGSAGPIRFVVNEDELVAAVIDTALKSYAREGRLPVLGSDFNSFVLYSPCAGTEALCPLETIGSLGVRNFMLCKKPQTDCLIHNGKLTLVESPDKNSRRPTTVKKSSGNWKAWLNKSLAMKV